jgi:hypothetical protein
MLKRLSAAGEPDVHAVGKPDQGGKTPLRHREQHGNVGLNSLGDKIDQPAHLRLRAAEAIEDDEIGAVFDRGREPAREPRELVEIESASSGLSGYLRHII